MAKFLAVLTIAIVLAGCRKSSVSSSGVSSVVLGTNLYQVVVASQYDSGGDSTVEKTCSVPVGSAEGTVVSCTVTIPELRLFFSKLTFKHEVNTSVSTCVMSEFVPYFYWASTSAVFKPSWAESEIDCTQTPIPKSCFSGVAIDIVPGFPVKSSLFFLTAFQTSAEYTAKSAYAMNRLSNRWTVNNNPSVVTARAMTTTTYTPGSFYKDSYVGGVSGIAYQNYQFRCYDKWFQTVYGIDLQVRDEDQSSGTQTPADPLYNQKPDWDASGWGL